MLRGLLCGGRPSSHCAGRAAVGDCGAAAAAGPGGVGLPLLLLVGGLGPPAPSRGPLLLLPLLPLVLLPPPGAPRPTRHALCWLGDRVKSVG